MSARGVKGSSVAKGGTDGSDFSHRQVLAPRYEAMATYRAQLVQLFNYLPYFYIMSVLLTALHFHAPGLKGISATFLPPFWLQMTLLVLSGVVTLTSIKQMNVALWMGLSGFSTLFVLYLTVAYAMQCLSPAKGESIGFVWYLVGALINALVVLLNSLGIYNGYMITLLQGSKRSQ